MKRDYADGVKNDVKFFVGTEIEKTPAYGMRTLFVVGIQSPIMVVDYAAKHQCEHIFVGANQCFDPDALMAERNLDLHDAMQLWDNMIVPLLKNDYLVTLDFDVKHVETVLECGWNEHENFIPQISVKVPYIKQFNYNAMLKVDDRDFKATNPGVWCHSVHSLMTRETFTDWREYKGDQPL
jgi:hypothetical protein